MGERDLDIEIEDRVAVETMNRPDKRDADRTMRHSSNWHRVMDSIRYRGLPVVSAMEGALSEVRRLAERIAGRASLSNDIMIPAISRIEDMAKADGPFTESLCAALTQTSPDAVQGRAAFVEKRAPAFC